MRCIFCYTSGVRIDHLRVFRSLLSLVIDDMQMKFFQAIIFSIAILAVVETNHVQAFIFDKLLVSQDLHYWYEWLVEIDFYANSSEPPLRGIEKVIIHFDCSSQLITHPCE